MTTDRDIAPKPWDDHQINAWYQSVISGGKVRDYGAIVSRLQKLPANTHWLQKYADIQARDETYAGIRVTVGDLQNGKPNILITGGVHGYEPSGIEASIAFLKDDASALSAYFNFVVYPCLSPWAYEYDQRWNSQAQDPNRLFSRGDDIVYAAECYHFMNDMEANGTKFSAAIDLHETPDRDVELRRMRWERFGHPPDPNYKIIPQGFHLILTQASTPEDNERQLLFGETIIENVRELSPIAPDEVILGQRNQGGVLLVPAKEGLLRHYLATHANHVAVTEVYPDHPSMAPETSVDAQWAAIHGVVQHILNLRSDFV